MIVDYVFSKNKESRHIAIIEGDAQIPYIDLYINIQHLVSILEHYIKKGNKVLLLIFNSVDFALFFFALNSIGATVVLCDLSFKEEVNDIINDSGATWVISKKSLMYINGFESVDIGIAGMFVYTIGGFFVDKTTVDTDISVIMYTSGSTGKPRGVCNTSENIIQSLENYTQTVPICNNDTIMGVVPFTHSYGFGSCFLASLYIGATLIVYDEFKPYSIIDAMAMTGTTVFFGVPYMYNVFLQLRKDVKKSFEKVRLFVSAGSALYKELYIAFYKKYNKIIHQEYGSTETGTISFNLSEDIDKGCSSVGTALKNVLVYKLDQEDTLFVRSKAIAKGYVDGKLFNKEQYDTKDIGYINDNYIYIVGRKKRQLNIAGLKVHPEEIERVIKQHPAISDAMVSCKRDNVIGDIIVAIVVRQGECSTEELIRFCSKHMAAYKVPHEVLWVKQIDKSSSGKNRFLLGFEVNDSELVRGD